MQTLKQGDSSSRQKNDGRFSQQILRQNVRWFLPIKGNRKTLCSSEKRYCSVLEIGMFLCENQWGFSIP